MMYTHYIHTFLLYTWFSLFSGEKFPLPEMVAECVPWVCTLNLYPWPQNLYTNFHFRRKPENLYTNFHLKIRSKICYFSKKFSPAARNVKFFFTWKSKKFFAPRNKNFKKIFKKFFLKKIFIAENGHFIFRLWPKRNFQK